MQLPRGQFHDIIKSTTVRALSEGMTSAQFTGICTIVLGSESATLVLNEGLVVLAERGSAKGQRALDAVFADEDRDVAAELNTLTPEQIRLALEFNRPFVIGNSGKPPAGKAAPGGTTSSAGPKSGSAAFSSRHRPEPTAGPRRIPMPGAKSIQKTAETPQSGGDEIDTLVQSMEDLDVEQLVSSFRVNCKDMLKKIHLDHLIKDQDA